MANRAYLVGGSDPEPAGPRESGINYDPDTEILAGASYCVPVYWLALFDESDIQPLIIEEYRIPNLVCAAQTARTRLLQRTDQLCSRFEKTAFADWQKLIEEAPFSYFKADLTEIWDLDPDKFAPQLRSAVRWFTSHAFEDRTNLNEISGIDNVRAGDSLGHHLHGYSWVRAVPWKDS